MRPKDMRPKDMRRKDMRRKDMRRKVLRLYANSYIYRDAILRVSGLHQFIYVDMRRKALRLYANSNIYVETRYFASPDLRVSGPHHLFKKKHFVSPVQDYLKYT